MHGRVAPVSGSGLAAVLAGLGDGLLQRAIRSTTTGPAAASSPLAGFGARCSAFAAMTSWSASV
ncbi:hypothetical protein ACFTWD_31475 [Streptomyces sp. NPDC056943]|uniref:hypothetical protein n=1 Tax=Streptomyces sp. NPDC056943 TaxID=3345971 RepID=UPI003626C9F5